MAPTTQPAEAALAATGETPQITDADASSPPTAQPQTALQDVLPEINQLAARVGGLGRLARLIDELRQSKD
jgi:hypothetical protein